MVVLGVCAVSYERGTPKLGTAPRTVHRPSLQLRTQVAVTCFLYARYPCTRDKGPPPWESNLCYLKNRNGPNSLGIDVWHCCVKSRYKCVKCLEGACSETHHPRSLPTPSRRQCRRRANLEQVSQSRLESGLGLSHFQTKLSKMF